MVKPKPKVLIRTLLTPFRKDYWVVIIKRRSWLRRTLLAVFLSSLFVAVGGYYYMFHYTGDLLDDKGNPIDFTKPEKPHFKIASYVYDDKGEPIGRFFEEVRDPIEISQIPKIVQNAFIAVEDKRFRDHSGVDFIAVARAFIGNTFEKFNIKYWRSSGASSIPQQYVRLTYGEEVKAFRNRDHTIARKIKEAKIAIQLIKQHPREKILENYLNSIYFGHGVNGVAEAFSRYFDRDIRKTVPTAREVAIIVSLNKSPAVYCPIFHKPAEPKIAPDMKPDVADKLRKDYDKQLADEGLRMIFAIDRYNWALGRMRDEGYISEQEYQTSLFKKEDHLDLEALKVKPLKDPAFSYGNRMVKELLLGQGHSDKELSASGGLRIYTTINTRIQKIASEEFEKYLAYVNQEKQPQDRLNGAFVIIEVKTGNILALSGGNDFNETQYNRVMASRSPGSGFKPFTYATALEYGGKDFFSQICNCPFSMRGSRPGERWAPKNFVESNPLPYGNVDLAIALIRSVNLPTLDLARSIGIDSVVRTANSMGVWGNPGIVRDSNGDIWFRKPGYQIKGGLVPLLPTALGASDVNLLELANAYTVFFRNGVYIRPTLVKSVGSAYGNEIKKTTMPEPRRILSEETATKMLGLLRAATKIGTARTPMKDIQQQVACKTGTSDGPRDLSIWCGSPEMVIAIRFGHDDYRVIELPKYMKKMSGRADLQVSGGWVVGPVARKIIDRIYSETRSQVQFSEGVELKLKELLDHYNRRNP